MTEPDWDSIAKRILDQEQVNLAHQRPPGQPILLDWRNEVYLGSLQAIALEYSPEIVLLSKTSKPLPLPLKEAILKQQPSHSQIIANPELNLEDRLHIVRRTKDYLSIMTPDQTAYAQQHIHAIGEINTGEIAIQGPLVPYLDRSQFN
jgi:hypothetical protein